MIYLLLGKDSFSKKSFIANLASPDCAILAFYHDRPGQTTQEIIAASKRSGLFEKKKLIKIFDLIAKIDLEQIISQTESSQTDLVFIEEKLDKRKAETKRILANKKIKTLEFETPSGEVLRKWVTERAKTYGLQFDANAMEFFLQRIGFGGSTAFGTEQSYDLWQIDSELKKLRAFANGAVISKEDVSSLVFENIEENVFEITNAIADKNRRIAMDRLADYLDRMPGTDEKIKIIGLSALVAEQFRSILLIMELLKQGKNDQEIIKSYGFSPGKLFVYKKLAKSFASEKIFTLLKKLEILDEELKTSSNPAGLQFLMIINGMLG